MITYVPQTQDVEGIEVPRAPRLTYPSTFCPETQDPFDMVEWKRVDVVLKDVSGEVIFEQYNVEAPAGWSDRAISIVAQKYFRGRLGTDQRESSVRQIVTRVVDTIYAWVLDQEYFETKEDAQRYRNDLTYLLLTQRGAFNSPVWFNLGVQGEPQQCSACFIQSVSDNLTSIAQLQMDETMVFRLGSGSGSNLSNLRSSKEHLRGGGTASGPVSFMRGYDAWAGVIKSGGKTRRAAKMTILNVDHPDAPEFIECKMVEEKRAHALIAAGFSADFTDPQGAYASVAFQNANHSVRVTDDFMEQVEYALSNPDAEVFWDLVGVTDGEVISRVPVLELWHKICASTWFCGDPGLQFDTTINAWHTCPTDGRINASNPCCFRGETLVETSEGRIAIEELAAMDARGDVLPYALAYDFDAQLPIAKPITHAWKAGETCQLTRVTTQRGATFFCTVDHPFYLHDGTPVLAQNLEPNMRLRKLGFARNTQRANRRVVYHRATNAAPKGQQWFARWLYESVHGLIPEGHEVHHENGKASDERISNYGLTEKHAHRREHAQGEANARYLDVEPRLLVGVWEALEALPRKTHKTTVGVTPGRWNKYVTDHDLKGTVPLARYQGGIGLIRGQTWAEFEAFIDTHRGDTNDRVESVEAITLDRPVAVYDIEVEGVHNFGVAFEGLEHAIVVSNSEYMFLDDSACNLASLNIMKFRREDGTLDHKSFCEAASVFTIAQDAVVDKAHYPTELIGANSSRFRPLGLGYANLGAYLMSVGLAYDSEEGRRVAAEITSMMSAQAYTTSALVAAVKGPFANFNQNRGAMLRVIDKHREAAAALGLESAFLWDHAAEYGEEYGYRNAQVTVLAPTGTIGFMMDCDTTGVEPDSSLYKVKQLVGGGTIIMENRTVERALDALGYSPSKQVKALQWLGEHQCFDNCPHIAAKHLPVFDCAIPSKGTRVLSVGAHLKMTAAVQPFLSGAISKTMNLPFATTPDQISEAYLEAWRLGIKAVALYRDGCKLSQPLVTAQREKEEKKKKTRTRAVRRRLQDHQTNCHRIKFRFGDVKGYLIATPYEDTGMPGEIFIEWAKEGSTVSGLVDGWAQAISYCLQYGVPLAALVHKYSHTKFEPAGFSQDPDIRYAHSIYDALMRKLAAVFLEKPVSNGHALEEAVSAETPDAAKALQAAQQVKDQSETKQFGSLDNPPCMTCGSITVSSGANCYKCNVCGASSGCG